MRIHLQLWIDRSFMTPGVARTRSGCSRTFGQFLVHRNCDGRHGRGGNRGSPAPGPSGPLSEPHRETATASRANTDVCPSPRRRVPLRRTGRSAVGRVDWSSWPAYDAADDGLRDYWYPVEWSSQVGRAPSRVRVLAHQPRLDPRRRRARSTRWPIAARTAACRSRSARRSSRARSRARTTAGPTASETASSVAVITDGPDSPICGKVRVRHYPDRGAARPRLGLHRRPRAAPVDRRSCPRSSSTRRRSRIGGRIEDRDGDWRCSRRERLRRGPRQVPPPHVVVAAVQGDADVEQDPHRAARALDLSASRTSAHWDADFPGLGHWTNERWWKRKPKQAQGKILGQHGRRQERYDPYIESHDFAGLRVALAARACCASPTRSSSTTSSTSRSRPAHAVRRRHGAVQEGRRPGRLLREVPRCDPVAVPRELLGAGPLDGLVDGRAAGAALPARHLADRVAPARRGGQPVRRRRPRPNRTQRPDEPCDGSRRAACPGRPDGRRRDAHEYHVVDLAPAGRPCSSTAADRAAPAGATSGRSRTASPPDARLPPRRPAAVRPVGEADHQRSDVGLPRGLDGRAARRARRSSGPTSCATHGAARSHSTSAARLRTAPRRSVVTGSMPVLYGPLRCRFPKAAAAAGNARDRYYGGEGPTWEKMRATHGPPRVVRRVEDPGRDRHDALRAEPRRRGDARSPPPPTSLAATGRT